MTPLEIISCYRRASSCFIIVLCFAFPKINGQHQDVSTESVLRSISGKPGSGFLCTNSPLTLSRSLTADMRKKRCWLIGGVSITAYGGSFVVLSDAWFKGSPHSSFHFFNDIKEWNQADKAGHAWTAYNMGRISAAMWEWAGVSNHRAVWIGGGVGLAYLVSIEWMDAHSQKWGWSWGDIGADIFGSSFFILQQQLWGEQRIQYKFSFHRKRYGETFLDDRAEDLFGKSGFKRTLQDYNAQTYWFSTNIKSFFKDSRWPGWLNVSIGYGADGMLGEFENKWIDNSGTLIDRTDIQRHRQFYFCPDIDFTKIRTAKKWLRTIFFCLNAFKCPAPTLLLNSRGRLKFYPIYF